MTALDERGSDLVSHLPDVPVITDPDITEGYRRDRADDPDAGRPLAVVRARSTEDVQAVMRWASAEGVPVVPRGAGTGLSGGAPAGHRGNLLAPPCVRQ